jgi:hypothetical protein
VSIRGWWKRRIRRSRRSKAAKQNRDKPLREFVYLDEVSVFSLMASRIGALATEFTESESTSLSTEVKSRVGASAAVAKAEVASSLTAGESSETQIMRKSTVQSTFKELLDYVGEELVLKPSSADGQVPTVRQAGDLLALAGKDADWVVDTQDLTRGRLVEVDVELEADDHFRASALLSTILDFLDTLPQMPEGLDTDGVLGAVTGTRMLEMLLAGLVPLRGRSIDYVHLTLEGRELIVRRPLLDQVPDLRAEARDLVVVGVAERELFWRDIRRVLFSNSRFRMLCRVGRDGAQLDWNPVKMLDMLGAALPPLRDAVDEIPALLASMGDESDGPDPVEDQMRIALEHYAVELTAVYEHPLTMNDLAARGLPTSAQVNVAAYGTFEERRAAFAELTGTLADELGFATTADRLETMRSAALVDAGALPPGSAAPPVLVMEHDEKTDSDAEAVRYLDCEFVAIYW